METNPKELRLLHLLRGGRTFCGCIVSSAREGATKIPEDVNCDWCRRDVLRLAQKMGLTDVGVYKPKPLPKA